MPFDITGMPQFIDVDGSLYVYNYIKKQWYRFCVVDAIPESIKTQAIESIKKSEWLKKTLDVPQEEDKLHA